MVNARDFGNGKTALAALEHKWRTDIIVYGQLCAALAKEQAGSEAWHRLNRACDKALLALYTHAAEMELDAQRYREMVAKEA